MDCIYNGIDISEESINFAKKNYGSLTNVSFQVYEGKKIPFENNTFDLVFMSCVMHHIKSDDHKSIIEECKRVLKDNGLIIIFEHNPNNPLTLKAVNTCPFDKDAVLLKSKQLKNLFVSCGLKDVLVRYTIFIPRKGILEKLTFIEKFLYWLPIGGQYYIVGKKQSNKVI